MFCPTSENFLKYALLHLISSLSATSPYFYSKIFACFQPHQTSPCIFLSTNVGPCHRLSCNQSIPWQGPLVISYSSSIPFDQSVTGPSIPFNVHYTLSAYRATILLLWSYIMFLIDRPTQRMMIFRFPS